MSLSPPVDSTSLYQPLPEGVTWDNYFEYTKANPTAGVATPQTRKRVESSKNPACSVIKFYLVRGKWTV